MKVLILGDSLTGSYGVASGKAWTDYLKNKYGNNIRISTYNGYSTTDLLTVFAGEIIKFHPDTLFLLGGTNDALTLRPASQAFNNLMLMYEECERRGISTHILLPPLLNSSMAASGFGDPVSQYEKANEMLKRLRRLLLDQSQENSLEVFDIEFIAEKLIKEGILPYSDGIHFSEEMHKELYNNFTEKFHSMSL